MPLRFKWSLLILFSFGIFFQGCESSQEITPPKKEVVKKKATKAEASATKTVSESPKRSLLSKFPEKTEFVKDGKPNVLIVYGKENKDLAFKLRDKLKKMTGLEFPMMLDSDATGGKRWTLKDDVKNQNLLLLGNINNNRGVLALYTKLLAAANAEFPGEGRYVVRHLAEPFVRGKTALLVGASDRKGLEIGVERLFAELEKQDFTLGFPFLEFGDTNGPFEDKPTGNERFRDYADAAYVFYSNGQSLARYSFMNTRSPRAGMKAAKEMVIRAANDENDYFPAGGHYQWCRNYPALRIIIAHGLLNPEEQRKVEKKLLNNALKSKDAFVKNFERKRNRTLTEYSRHSITTLVGQYLLDDYLHHFARLDPEVSEKVKADYEMYGRFLRDLTRQGVFRAVRPGDHESLDCVAPLIYGLTHLGIEEFINNGMLDNMVAFYLNSVNNLWCLGGASFYIGAYNGTHLKSNNGGLAVLAKAFFDGDSNLAALKKQSFERSGNYSRGFRSAHSMTFQQPGAFGIPGVAQGVAPKLPMLTKVPVEPRSFADFKLEHPERYFNNLVFRDGATPEDAWLSLQGWESSARTWNVLTINGFTDHGARFLFGHSMRYENWSRSGVCVDTTKYHPHDRLAVEKVGAFDDEAAIFAAVCPQFNACSWQRSIIHRKRGCFIVLDSLTALDDDDYNFNVTWRILPQSKIASDGSLRAHADNGASFAIIPARKYLATLTKPEVDGSARATFYRQMLDQVLKKGQRVNFINVIASAPAGKKIDLKVESVNPEMVLIKTSDNTSLAGLRKLSGGTLPEGDCVLFELSPDKWLIGGTKQVKLAGNSLLDATAPVDLFVDFKKRSASVWTREENCEIKLAPTLGGEGRKVSLKPGKHDFKITLTTDPKATIAAFEALPRDNPPLPVSKTFPRLSGLEMLWRTLGQQPPPRIIKPLSISSTDQPNAMALHNLHDGMLCTSSIPYTVWLRKDKVTLTLSTPKTEEISGLLAQTPERISEIEIRNDDGSWKKLKFTVEDEPCFRSRSAGSYYTGALKYLLKRYRFNTRGNELRVTFAKAENAKAIRCGELFLLGPPLDKEVWGRLRIVELGRQKKPILLCRSGTYLDNLERGGLLQAFALDGTKLWSQTESAPAQYRDKSMIVEDIDGDGVKEVITWSDDMTLKIHEVSGKIVKEVDLKRWERENGKEIKQKHRGAKSIVAWPEHNGRKDIFAFMHVDQYQVKIHPKEKVVYRKRQPGDYECAPAASVAVTGWSKPGAKNLIGVGPWSTNMVLWESQGDDAPPKLVLKRAYQQPFGQLTANNLLPAFVECLKTRNPEGVIAASPRGVQFFAKPDLKPGWTAPGSCPTSAAMLFHQDNGGADRVIIGRENGRVLVYDVMSGKLLAENLLEGAVRRVEYCKSGEFIVGTSKGIFVLKDDLSIVGFMSSPIEDIAVYDTENQITIYALSSDGRLSGFDMNTMKNNQ